MSLNTKTTFSIAGKQFETFHNIELRQNLDDHHYFEIYVSYDWFENFGNGISGASKQFLGEEIEITVAPAEQLPGIKNLSFKGIIMSVTAGKHGDGTHGHCIIRGSGASILLEDDPHIQAFENKSLADIVNTTISAYPPNLLRANVSPETSESQKYVVQYKESSYAFIKRLSERHGEWFFYNGQQIIFGKYSPQKIALTHQIDLLDFNIELTVKPNNIKFNGYDYRQANVVEDKTQAKETGGSNPYSKHAQQISSKLYSKEALYKINYPFNSNAKAQLDKMATLQKKAQVSRMVTLQGSSKNPSIRIGDTVSIQESVISQEQHGEFLITDIRHYCGANGSYHNMFSGIPADTATPAINLYTIPHSEPQSATVIENNDPKGLGRIKVRFQWQQQGQTPWVRVLSAAGGGEKGFFMIPEKGEEVVVDFEGGNPEAPFIIGATYNGKAKSSFGNAANDIKAIKTRSGNTIKLDDKTGSISVTDKNGSTMTMDGAGNITVKSKTLVTIETSDKIELKATNSISLDAKHIYVTGSETASIGGGKEGSAMMVLDTTGKQIHTSAKEIYTNAESALEMDCKANMEIRAKILTTAAKEKITMDGGQQMLLNAKMTTDVKGGMLNLNC